MKQSNKKKTKEDLKIFYFYLNFVCMHLQKMNQHAIFSKMFTSTTFSPPIFSSPQYRFWKSSRSIPVCSILNNKIKYMENVWSITGLKAPAALQEKPEPVFNAPKMNNTELSQQLSQEFLSKLSQLEKLQYQLTKQVRVLLLTHIVFSSLLVQVPLHGSAIIFLNIENESSQPNCLRV